MESRPAESRVRFGLSVSPGPHAGWPTALEFLQVVVLAIGLTVVARLLTPTVTELWGDNRYYIAMASDPDTIVRSPFSYRVLTPWLVAMLGTPVLETYHAISLGFFSLTGPLVYLITRGLGGVHAASLLATIGLLTLRGWLFNFDNPYLADGAAMFLTAAAFAALVWGVDLLLPAIVAAWALSREVWAGFAIPAYAWFRQRFDSPSAIVRVAVMSVPGLIVTLTLFRLTAVEGAAGFSVIGGGVLERVAESRGSDLGFWVPYAFAGSLGIWWILALSRPRIGGRLWWWMVPVFGQLLLGGDWSRFAMYAFVVVIPVGAMALWSHRMRAVLLGLVAMQLLPTVADVLADGRLELNRPQPSVPITLWLMVATAGVLVIPLIARLVRRSVAYPEASSTRAFEEPTASDS